MTRMERNDPWTESSLMSRGPPRAPRSPAVYPFTPTHDPTPVKSPSDYLRALRRRIWLVLAVGVPLSVGRRGLVRPAAARLPRDGRRSRSSRRSIDPVLSTLVSHDVGRRDAESDREVHPEPGRPAQEQGAGRAGRSTTPRSCRRADAARGGRATSWSTTSRPARSRSRPTGSPSRSKGPTPPGPPSCSTLLLELFQKQAKDEIDEQERRLQRRTPGRA